MPAFSTRSRIALNLSADQLSSSVREGNPEQMCVTPSAEQIFSPSGVEAKPCCVPSFIFPGRRSRRGVGVESCGMAAARAKFFSAAYAPAEATEKNSATIHTAECFHVPAAAVKSKYAGQTRPVQGCDLRHTLSLGASAT